MTGDNQSSSATVSAEDFQEVRAQMRQLMQGMQAIQLSLQQQRGEPPPVDNDHIEDENPFASAAEDARLRAEAAHRATAGGDGHDAGRDRGRGGVQRHATGFGSFGAHRGLQNFGRAWRVPIGGAADFDFDENSDYGDDGRHGGFAAHGGGYNDRGGAPLCHFGAFGDQHFGGNDGHRDRRRGDHERRRNDDGLGKVKISIPSFNGKENDDSYYEWETKVDQIFDLYEYPAEKKVKLAAIEFKGYAITWWNQICAEYHRVGHDRITWEDMKREMRRRFCSCVLFS
jgi:hypothetical protein